MGSGRISACPLRRDRRGKQAANAPITQQPGFVTWCKCRCTGGFHRIPICGSARLRLANLSRHLGGGGATEANGGFGSRQDRNLRPKACRCPPLRHNPSPSPIPPLLEKLLPELSPALSLSWADATGWHRRSRAPFPLASPQSDEVTIGALALGISILLPALNRGRETANRVKCASNERQIGQAWTYSLTIIAGAYPGEHCRHAHGGRHHPHVFICPSSGTSLPANHVR